MVTEPSDRDLLRSLADLPSRQSHLLFEEFALATLRREAERQGRGLLSQASASKEYQHRYDAVLPEGLDNLPGPTAVEVKLLRRELTGSRLGYSVSHLFTQAIEDGMRSLLVIVAGDVSVAAASRVRTLADGFSIPVDIWDSDTLLSRRGGSPAVSMSDLALAPLKRAAGASPPDWRQAQRDHLESLHRIYRDEGVALFLGRRGLRGGCPCVERPGSGAIPRGFHGAT